MFEIDGKVALVTGGASGLGLAYAVELLKNGAKGVVLGDINKNAGQKVVEELSQTFGKEKVLFVELDVRRKEQFEDAFKETIKEFKNIDILINNAGIMDDRIWEQQVDINVKGTITGTLLAIQTYIHKYKSGEEGVIVNISSVAGISAAPVFPMYSATKHAIIGLTRSFGTKMHYKISNVRIIALCPGMTNTPLMTDAETKASKSIYSEKLTEYMSVLSYQEPAYVAKSAIELIKTARQGSIWIIENNEPLYEYSAAVQSQSSKVK